MRDRTQNLCPSCKSHLMTRALDLVVLSVLAVVLVLAYLVMTVPVYAGPLDETRYCGPPARNAKGEIIRRADVRAAFRKNVACPSTKKHTGPCPGWVLDHPGPLACGYCDSVSNLQWLPVEMWKAKSLWERQVYGGRGISEGCP